tara:strand:+ start:744 stop:1043 length:300 start_codon:yes stop_codon:yes gene_type:complete
MKKNVMEFACQLKLTPIIVVSVIRNVPLEKAVFLELVKKVILVLEEKPVVMGNVSRLKLTPIIVVVVAINVNQEKFALKEFVLLQQPVQEEKHLAVGLV